MRKLILLICLLPPAARADVVMPARTIRADTVIGPQDVMLKDLNIPGALSRLDQVVGLEARVALYPGRPVREGEVGPAAIVERNQLVTLVYRQAGLEISTEGRALGRGAAGEDIRVMNVASRGTVFGRIRPDGAVEVK